MIVKCISFSLCFFSCFIIFCSSIREDFHKEGHYLTLTFHLSHKSDFGFLHFKCLFKIWERCSSLDFCVKIYFYFMCMSFCLHVCMCNLCVLDPDARRVCQFPWKWSYILFGAAMWLLAHTWIASVLICWTLLNHLSWPCVGMFINIFALRGLWLHSETSQLLRTPYSFSLIFRQSLEKHAHCISAFHHRLNL